MVKKFVITQTFPANTATVRQLLFCEQFEERAHHARGNIKVSVTEWMSTGTDTSQQRLCFFTMVDDSGLGNFICMETQKCWFSDDSFHLTSSISPDNSSVGGNVFSIRTKWEVTDVGDITSELKIFGEVECKKSIIGFQGVVEGTLSNKAQNTYECWCAEALKHIELELSKKQQEQKDEEKNSLEKTKLFFQSNKIRLTRRLRSIQRRVVSGTENIISLFQDYDATTRPSTESDNFVIKEKESEDDPTEKGDGGGSSGGGGVLIDLEMDGGGGATTGSAKRQQQSIRKSNAWRMKFLCIALLLSLSMVFILLLRQ